MSKTKTLIYCSLFTALIAAGAFIKIPVPVVPFTLQYLFTMLAGLLLGSKRGTISVVAEFWLYHWILPRNLRDRTYRRTSEEKDDLPLPARKPGWTYDRLCLRHDLLLCDLQLCDQHTDRDLAAHPLLLPSCSTW